LPLTASRSRPYDQVWTLPLVLALLGSKAAQTTQGVESII
jgi:hypothetical protein